MEVLKRDYPRTILSSSPKRKITGLVIELDPYADDDDTVNFRWCLNGKVFLTFPFKPRDSEALDLLWFLREIQIKEYNQFQLVKYKPKLFSGIILQAEKVFTLAKKEGFFSTLPVLANDQENEGCATRAGESLEFIESFSFLAVKSQWFVNYLSLSLGCSSPIIISLTWSLEKIVEEIPIREI